MQYTACTRCGEKVTILHDGTLVEHAQPDQHALLCAGSRTKPEIEPDDSAASMPMAVRKRREVVFN